MSIDQYEIVDGWFSIEMKEIAPLPLPLPLLPAEAYVEAYVEANAEAYVEANGAANAEANGAANGAANGGLKEMQPLPQAARLKETQKLYEFDESKLIELDPIDDAFLLETDQDIIKILNDLF